MSLTNKMVSRRKRRETRTAYAFHDTGFDYYYSLYNYPIIGSLILMFYNYSVLEKQSLWVFKTLSVPFKSREFLIAVKNSIVFVVIVPIIQILSILIALFVNRKIPGISFIPYTLYIPVVTFPW